MSPFKVLTNYFRRDQARWFWLKQRAFWVPYERYEYTRLSSIREEMDMHRTYKKETILGDEAEDGEEEVIIPGQNATGESEQSTKNKKEKDSFIWTFLIRPVHEDGSKK